MNELVERTEVLPDLVNRLTRELSELRRESAAVARKLSTTARTLEGRTQELTEARAAVALLLATLDATTDGIIAMGHFGRAMHYNERFVQMWRIAPDKLPTLSDSALLAMQLAQVKDPAGFLALAEACKASPEREQSSLVHMTDGRVLQCRVMPQRVRGKRVGTVTSYRDVTDRHGPGA
ncbi:PAS domain-containing protein [Caenimonas aquaedulcis]|uniref:PAS domain-containing protein n=1 Tax=Caenimonas aquaedulcis TaxID=2793270 RepID=A0A931H6D9_9BURK|nr:PAS domain-containing protein [Caenimonas aquaedulcis]MBG9389514.1 PAS domain-containing protein [Caenimonas aquaedulcis]